MIHKLSRLGAALALMALMMLSTGCSNSKSDANTGPTAPPVPNLDSGDGGDSSLTAVQALGLAGDDIFARHDSDSDSDTDGDSDTDSDTDGDSDTDSDSDTDGDSDSDSDTDGCDSSGPGNCDDDADTDGDSDSDGDTDGDSDGDSDSDDGFSPSGSSFSGRLSGVSSDGRTLELANGTQVTVGANTFWEPDGDLFSVADIELALAQGERVKVEGRGRLRQDGTFRVQEIKAESRRGSTPGDDFEGLADEFRGRVDAADASSRSLFLRNGKVIVVRRSVEWDPRGDLFSFREVVAAVDRGAQVKVEGFGELSPDGTILASSIKAETRGDGIGGRVGDDEFESGVIGVDLGSGRMFLANGITLVVDASTVWDPLGDLFTLESTATAVALGRPVRAEGDGALQGDGTVRALTLKVEVDD